MRNVLYACLGIIFCIGCTSTRSSSRHHPGEGIDRVRYMELREMAKTKLTCDANDIRYQYLGEKLHLLSGCGKKIWYLVFSLNGKWVKTESFHPKASHELKCRLDNLEATRTDENMWNVSGCGKQATYILICDSNNTKCKWLSDA